MNYIQKITKIRERGQLTVPYEIRKALDWYDQEQVVKIETTTSGFRVEQLPVSHPQNPKKKLSEEEWKKIFEEMREISKSGKQRVNLAEAIRRERDKHF